MTLDAWRLFGLDIILRKAWESGVILCGLSAGSICWFESAPTDSLQTGELTPLLNGLGILQGSHCPHYSSDPVRRPTYQRMVTSGILQSGWAVDDGAALRFTRETVVKSISSRTAAQAWRVEKTATGVSETKVPTRYLGLG